MQARMWWRRARLRSEVQQFVCGDGSSILLPSPLLRTRRIPVFRVRHCSLHLHLRSRRAELTMHRRVTSLRKKSSDGGAELMGAGRRTRMDRESAKDVQGSEERGADAEADAGLTQGGEGSSRGCTTTATASHTTAAAAAC